MFQGSIVAIVTPWKNGEFDPDAFARLRGFDRIRTGRMSRERLIGKKMANG